MTLFTTFMGWNLTNGYKNRTMTNIRILVYFEKDSTAVITFVSTSIFRRKRPNLEKRLLSVRKEPKK